MKDVTLPERSREIAEICGNAIPYEVDWPGIENDAAALNFLDNLSCHRLGMALRMICSDEMGCQAVRQGLSLVPITFASTTRCSTRHPFRLFRRRVAARRRLSDRWPPSAYLASNKRNTPACPPKRGRYPRCRH